MTTLRLALQNIGRNLFLSLATTTMMGLILFIFNIILVLGWLTDSGLEALGNKVDLVVYLEEGASLFHINESVELLTSMDEVESIDYTSKEQALKNYLDLNPEQAELIESFGLDNPLPASLTIVTHTPEDHEHVLQELEDTSLAPFISDLESASENRVITERLLSIQSFTEKLLAGVIIAFLFGGVLMIINAIHLSLFTRKTEIQIMQLVGASPHMIRWPFLMEGLIYSFVAVFFSLGLLALFMEGTGLRKLSGFEIPLPLWQVIGLEFLLSLLVGLFASLLGLHHYLKRQFFLEA